MNADREVLGLECQVRLIEHAAKQDPKAVAIDLFIDGFWEGVRAATSPRSRERLEILLNMHRARAAGLIK